MATTLRAAKARQRCATASCLAWVLALSLASGCSPSASENAALTEESAALSTSGSAATGLGAAQNAAGSVAGLPDFTGLVERFGNAVVNVEVTGQARGPAASVLRVPRRTRSLISSGALAFPRHSRRPMRKARSSAGRDPGSS